MDLRGHIRIKHRKKLIRSLNDGHIKPAVFEVFRAFKAYKAAAYDHRRGSTRTVYMIVYPEGVLNGTKHKYTVLICTGNIGDKGLCSRGKDKLVITVGKFSSRFKVAHP